MKCCANKGSVNENSSIRIVIRTNRRSAYGKC